jgi:hypothetical protein
VRASRGRALLVRTSRRTPMCWAEGKPLDAPPCREVATRRALGSGQPAVEPWFYFSKLWLNACVLAGRTPARRGHDHAVEAPDAPALDVASRAAREILESGLRAVVLILLQVWAGGSQGRAHPSAWTRLAAPPVDRRSRGAAVSWRRAPHVAPSATPPRAGVWLGLPSRSGTRRRPDRSHLSEMKGRRRRTERSLAHGRAAWPRVGLA